MIFRSNTGLSAFAARHKVFDRVDPALALPFFFIKNSFKSSKGKPKSLPDGPSVVPVPDPALPLILIIIPVDLRDSLTKDPESLASFMAAVHYSLRALLAPVAKAASLPVPSCLQPLIYNPTGHLAVSFPRYDYNVFSTLFDKTFPDVKRFNIRRREDPTVDIPIDFVIPNRFDDAEGIFFTYGVETYDDPVPALQEHFGDSIEVIKSAIVSPNSYDDPDCRALFDTPHWMEGFTPDLQESWTPPGIPIEIPIQYISIRLVKDTPESRQLFEAEFDSSKLTFKLVESFGVPSCKFCHAPFHSRPQCEKAPACCYCGSQAHLYTLCPHHPQGQHKRGYASTWGNRRSANPPPAQRDFVAPPSRKVARNKSVPPPTRTGPSNRFDAIAPPEMDGDDEPETTEAQSSSSPSSSSQSSSLQSGSSPVPAALTPVRPRPSKKKSRQSVVQDDPSPPPGASSELSIAAALVNPPDEPAHLHKDAPIQHTRVPSSETGQSSATVPSPSDAPSSVIPVPSSVTPPLPSGLASGSPNRDSQEFVAFDPEAMEVDPGTIATEDNGNPDVFNDSQEEDDPDYHDDGGELEDVSDYSMSDADSASNEGHGSFDVDDEQTTSY